MPAPPLNGSGQDTLKFGPGAFIAIDHLNCTLSRLVVVSERVVSGRFVVVSTGVVELDEALSMVVVVVDSGVSQEIIAMVKKPIKRRMFLIRNF